MGFWERAPMGSFRAYVRRASGFEAILVETGMGGKRLKAAIDSASDKGPVDLIISMGFAGALSHDFVVGRVLLGDRFIAWGLQHTDGARCNTAYKELPYELAEFCAANGIQTVQVVTVNECFSKDFLHRRLKDDGPSVVDMESALIARLALERGIPFICLRSISDALSDEIDFNLDEISDIEGRVKIFRVVRALVRQPRLLIAFYHAWRRSRIAGRRLGKAIADFLALPIPQMRRILDGIRLWAPCPHSGSGLDQCLPLS
jgi:adenosylhomocysteine nucleosidase